MSECAQKQDIIDDLHKQIMKLQNREAKSSENSEQLNVRLSEAKELQSKVIVILKHNVSLVFLQFFFIFLDLTRKD